MSKIPASHPLVSAHLHLPKAFVKTYLRRCPSFLGMHDDLISEAYLALVEAAHGFKPGAATFETWAWRAMRNAISDFTRAQFGAVASRHIEQASPIPDDYSETPAEFSDPADGMDAARTWETVKDELQAIPVPLGRGFRAARPGEAEDFLRLEFGGRTLKETAELRGVRPQTVHEQATRMRNEFYRLWPELIKSNN